MFLYCHETIRMLSSLCSKLKSFVIVYWRSDGRQISIEFALRLTWLTKVVAHSKALAMLRHSALTETLTVSKLRLQPGTTVATEPQHGNKATQTTYKTKWENRHDKTYHHSALSPHKYQLQSFQNPTPFYITLTINKSNSTGL